MTQTLVEAKHIRKPCPQCIAECKEDEGPCAPDYRDELGMAYSERPSSLAIHVDHEHLATIRDAVLICDRGHRSEADPHDAMRANGVPELFDL